MKRITVDQVREAFDKSGLKPQVDCMFDSSFDQHTPKCGCGLGAMYMVAGGDRFMTSTVSDVAAHLGLDKAYACGFSDGFDDAECCHGSWARVTNDHIPQYNAGYADGKAAGDLKLGRE